MSLEFPTIEEALAEVEPSPELLLQLAPWVTPDLVGLAMRTAMFMGLNVITIQILAALLPVAGEGEREQIQELLRQNEDLLEAGAPDLARPLREDVFERLKRQDASKRAELLEPVLRTMELAFFPATANGGGGGGDHGGEGAPMDEEPTGGPVGGEEGELGVANGHGAGPPPRRPRFVSTGFAPPATPRKKLPASEPLRPAESYLFWLEIGAPVTGSIEESPEEVVPEQQLEAGARIRVVVYPFDGELILERDARHAELELNREGHFTVPGRPRERRLFFPVSTPTKAGIYRLRCSLYFRNVLVQSRVVTAAVGQAPQGRRPALSAKVDFRLARLLSGNELAPIRQHALSIQLNSNGEGTHEFRFFGDEHGAEPFIENATLSEGALSDVITRARAELRRTMYGTTLPFQKTDSYRYLDPEPGQLEQDLFALMGQGFRIYDALINELAGGGGDAADRLLERMLPPGRIQITSHGSPSELVPASVIYDYGNCKPDSPDLSLCPQFIEDRKAPPPLEDAVCFQGKCPHRQETNVVCPSGFWGFRHALGMPVAANVPEAIPRESPFDPTPSLGLAIFPEFTLIKAHRAKLAAEVPGWDMRLADTFAATLDLLRSHPNIVYFYCHGGLTPDNTPFLRVGPEDGPRLERTDLRLHDPDVFQPPRSLIVLNGCRTAALEPDRAIELISAFVQNAGSMGVIGTEVTIFEELATAFGTELLHNLRQKLEVGESVRRARLALLKEGNPLGLVYLPFVASDARLVGPN